MSRGEWPLGDRVREREVLRTEVRRLHACKSVLGKFGCSLDCSGIRACTASHVFQGTDRQSRSPPKNPESCLLLLLLGYSGLPILHYSSTFAIGIALLQVFAAVRLALAADDRDARLYEITRSIYLKWYNCQALLRLFEC